MKRMNKRFRKYGDKGVVHRGVPGNRGYKKELKQNIIAGYRERYPDFGPTFAAEKLGENGYCVNAETLRS
jgi:hypothetical protein